MSASYFASYATPTEVELGNTLSLFVEGFSGLTPLVLKNTSVATITDPSGTVHPPTLTSPTTDGAPSSIDFQATLVGLWSWSWSVVVVPNATQYPNAVLTGVTSGTFTVRDNTAS